MSPFLYDGPATATVKASGSRWMIEFQSRGGWGSAYYDTRDEAERAAREYLALHAEDDSPEDDLERARR